MGDIELELKIKLYKVTDNLLVMTAVERDFDRLAKKFRAIGHAVTVPILNLLCTCDCPKLTVMSIYDLSKLDQPSTSRHLNIMRKSGMLKRIREGADTFYCLWYDDPQVGCIKKCFSK